eukprot:m.90496 g.90496  ORF g.90496 m.90496 type:complete len:207 (-) comp26401_c2_seq1:150-770(-)
METLKWFVGYSVGASPQQDNEDENFEDQDDHHELDDWLVVLDGVEESDSETVHFDGLSQLSNKKPLALRSTTATSSAFEDSLIEHPLISHSSKVRGDVSYARAARPTFEQMINNHMTDDDFDEWQDQNTTSDADHDVDDELVGEDPATGQIWIPVTRAQHHISNTAARLEAEIKYGRADYTDWCGDSRVAKRYNSRCYRVKKFDRI